MTDQYEYAKEYLKNKNYVNAKLALKIAYNEGNIDAARQLGKMYYHGSYDCNKNYDKANELFEFAICKGDDAVSMNYLGIMYEEGLGVQKNMEVALEFYTKSSQKNNNHGTYRMAGIYLTKKNYEKAIELYISLADKNYAKGVNGLGFMYYNGYGIQKDIVKAFEYFANALEKGNDDARKNIIHTCKHYPEIILHQLVTDTLTKINKTELLKEIYGYDDFVISIIKENAHLKKENAEFKEYISASHGGKFDI